MVLWKAVTHHFPPFGMKTGIRGKFNLFRMSYKAWQLSLTCSVGIPQMLYGKNLKITPEMIPDISKQPEVMAKCG
ncbi:hypothetical protein [Desulfobacterium sp. N47]|uniref:Uncharacterized protein n=1 Tax=uncultured Desulfobacterium sp. TaxID=201089 RepID=E1YJW9_9BACT|nr:unknown protein [uncultured Desulfobacterium sp.]